MNAVEQKNHKRTTDAIASDVAAIAEATADRLDAIERSLDAEQLDRIDIAKRQRAYVDSNDKAMYDTFREFHDRGFWGRMKWIVRGL